MSEESILHELNAELLDPRLLERHFTHEVLFSDHARVAIVDPDIRSLPALAC